MPLDLHITPKSIRTAISPYKPKTLFSFFSETKNSDPHYQRLRDFYKPLPKETDLTQTQLFQLADIVIDASYGSRGGLNSPSNNRSKLFSTLENLFGGMIFFLKELKDYRIFNEANFSKLIDLLSNPGLLKTVSKKFTDKCKKASTVMDIDDVARSQIYQQYFDGSITEAIEEHTKKGINKIVNGNNLFGQYFGPTANVPHPTLSDANVLSLILGYISDDKSEVHPVQSVSP